MLTVTGTALSVTAAVTLLPKGHFVTGPLVLLVVLVADSFDGILARATGKSSVFGAFLDSTMDRLADGAVLGSLAAWAALSMPVGALRTVTVAAALVAVVMAATVPYARARAESIGASASVGSPSAPIGSWSRSAPPSSWGSGHPSGCSPSGSSTWRSPPSSP